MTDKPMTVGEVIEHEWQEVSYGDFFHKYMEQILERTRVPGGWLYRTTIIDEGFDDARRISVSMVFVPNLEGVSYTPTQDVYGEWE